MKELKLYEVKELFDKISKEWLRANIKRTANTKYQIIKKIEKDNNIVIPVKWYDKLFMK